MKPTFAAIATAAEPAVARNEEALADEGVPTYGDLDRGYTFSPSGVMAWENVRLAEVATLISSTEVLDPANPNAVRKLSVLVELSLPGLEPYNVRVVVHPTLTTLAWIHPAD